MSEIKPVLDYLESEITEYCNLNCKGCGAFINLATEKNHYEIEEFERDYRRISELFSDIQKIRLMGGEPLLNPDLTEYVKICRNFFPKADIRIVTNGLMIPKMDIDSLITLKALDCKFDISNYAPTRKHYPQIKATLKKAGVDYDLGFPMDFFFRNLREHPSNNPEPSFQNCIITHCHKLSHGKLSPCTHAHCIGRLNQAFDLHFPETDCVNIYSDISGEQVLEYFNKPHELCKYCSEALIPFKWNGHYGIDKSDKYDWIIKDGFFNNKIAPIIQSILKKPEKWLRAQIQK